MWYSVVYKDGHKIGNFLGLRAGFACVKLYNPDNPHPKACLRRVCQVSASYGIGLAGWRGAG